MIPNSLPRLAAVLALAGAALAPAALTAQDNSGRKLSTTLSGAAEVPGPGDADATGSFMARINPGQTQLCYTLTVGQVDPLTAAHIHRGAEGTAGPPVVPLSTTKLGENTCTEIDKALAMELIKSPGDFYVNVHNAAYPNGAARGQLAK